ncbi:MAG: hypothetical protein KAS30_01650 [Candidatus Diapherotrites archaeon]|nr:hypothetical protein [Candidatus Diapherotrites archaeon]
MEYIKHPVILGLIILTVFSVVGWIRLFRERKKEKEKREGKQKELKGHKVLLIGGGSDGKILMVKEIRDVIFMEKPIRIDSVSVSSMNAEPKNLEEDIEIYHIFRQAQCGTFIYNFKEGEGE